ncbi:hypothetical protein C1Y08_18895 [Pseudomonas sp. FW306-02-F02-AA]|uniref:Uncharacterized protein n=1 Tax=Pseudomonas fluorescens TaxID=294 RepID=A0A0N9WEA4_PSEFL|nr:MULTISPECIES: hypothetical protein [Pseudomonas]ALH99959.1 hypothetical protein AO353_02450 [Pseudomonas fluorescens]PMZ00823.1 hypothetical protein C1Y07_28215 [Pseudomonas sp. FW306-02-F02-AB]PMZ06703.1 hypothetical protein C1Y06_28585 [Pseudomonas sp. FW306-02-H06C]PMZ14279.1 hypothetical protein C1Y08_18895 [Pseudomonas sp. FW306-02-F02-AA]PMZ18512.1 hypothetical protein C1Y09_29065 [Pseudomonas sp. FW306-02-F08-AA]
MSNVDLALVISIGGIVEEEVVLLVNGTVVKCFASYCPRNIVLGGSYEVELDMVIPDSDFIALAQETDVMVERVDDGFSCVLYGYLDGGIFRSFVDFSDQDIHYEYPSFNEQFVRIKVDRIDVAF